VRLRGRSADFVVNQSIVEPDVVAPGPTLDAGGDLIRLTLRMPESLKTHVEQAAAAEGISVNSWLVRAIAAAMTRPPMPPMPPMPPGPPPRPGRAGKRITGFAQA
jgi:hypothetical protein